MKRMTKEEVVNLMSQLRCVFDIVRLVDVTQLKQYDQNEQGELEEQPYHCYAVWKKNSRCINCISARERFI